MPAQTSKFRIRTEPDGRFLRMTAWLVPRGCKREPMVTRVPEHATTWSTRQRAELVLDEVRAAFPSAAIETVGGDA